MSFNQISELLFIIASGIVLIAIGLLFYVLHLIEALQKKIRELNQRLPIRDSNGRLFRERLWNRHSIQNTLAVIKATPSR